MLLSARDLQLKNPRASREEIREHLSGNYCRCTGYQAIVDAIEEVLHGTKLSSRCTRRARKSTAATSARACRGRTRSACCRGAARYIDDLRFPRLAHVAFFRSPHAHARIKKLDFAKARESRRA